MQTINRRKFLKIAATTLGAIALTPALVACQTSEPQTKTSPVRRAPTLPASAPYLVVARGGDPEGLVTKALAAFGGIEKFVTSGVDVILKPNICTAYHTYEYATTTNPWLIGTLVKLCLGAGAKSVKVMDFPFGGTAEEAYAQSGIAEQVKANGGEMVVMSDFKFIQTAMPAAQSAKGVEFYDDILKAPVLINVPIAKHHSLARLTMGMKNLLGVVKDRPSLHFNLGQNLADLAGFIQPTLTIIDATRILVANGPTGGSLDDVKQLDTLIVSPDIVAADAYGCSLFGLKPDDLNYIRAGVKSGVGRSDLENLKIEEITANA